MERMGSLSDNPMLAVVGPSSSPCRWRTISQLEVGFDTKDDDSVDGGRLRTDKRRVPE